MLSTSDYRARGGGDALGTLLHDLAGVLGGVKGWWDARNRRDDDS